MTLYKLVSYHPARKSMADDSIAAINTWELRKPKKGEWYLSGAVIEAYQAKSDLTTEFYIAKIVRIEKIIQYKILEELT